MNYANIKYDDIANGPGVRTSLFVSGCTHGCKGCFNEVAWDFKYGKLFSQETIDEILKSIEPTYISGLTILGGEPMEKVNQKGIFPLVSELKRRFPNKNLWIYSGYTFDIDLMPGGRAYCEETDKILSLCDVIVDGKFVESLYDITLRFRGSSNQRLIDVQRSLREGKAVLWEGDADFAVHSM
jgi:anaerobic ribonucleoside-triphosphate reductase activating protein